VLDEAKQFILSTHFKMKRSEDGDVFPRFQLSDTEIQVNMAKYGEHRPKKARSLASTTGPANHSPVVHSPVIAHNKSTAPRKKSTKGAR